MDSNISLDYYKIFYEVAKQQNISNAAKSLYVSQPAITQTIKKLEEKLGVTLFVRAKNGITLTKIGVEIFNHINTAMLEFGLVEDIVNNNQHLLRGELEICCSTNLAKKVLTIPIAEFTKRYPNIKIIHNDTIQKSMIEKLKLGEIDICITQKNDDIHDLKFVTLFDDSFVFVYNPENLKDKTCYIVQATGSYNRKLFNEFKKNTQTKILQVAGYNLAIELAKNGTGYALVPKFLVQENITKKQLKILDNKISEKTIEYGYYYNPNNLTKITEKFIEYLK